LRVLALRRKSRFRNRETGVLLSMHIGPETVNERVRIEGKTPVFLKNHDFVLNANALNMRT